jgi:uncharacterized LabA/DUF88 family protein
MAANRTIFLVDGFNLYHSLCDASRDLGKVSTKWLDLRALCNSYLPAIGGGAALEGVYYFSALAAYKLAVDPNVTTRHRAYIECLRETGVHVELSKFKSKPRWCPVCKRKNISHEEKETDVAIGVKLMEVFFRDLCDTAAIVTGDSDLVPAARSARSLFPGKMLCVISPYLRVGYELETHANKSFRIKRGKYLAHQLLNPFPRADGTTVSRPASW